MRRLSVVALFVGCLCLLSACDPIQTGLIDLQVVRPDAAGNTQPVEGAACTLGGDQTRSTDAEGSVQFAGASAGVHVLRCLLASEEPPLGGAVEVEVPLEAGRPGWVEASLTLVPVAAPAPVEASAEVGGAFVSWSEPASSGGLPVLGYRIVTLPDGPTIEVDALTKEVWVSELKARAVYVFEVAAWTAHGLGPVAVSKAVTIPGPPDSPTEVEAVAEGDAVRIRWKPPADDGGSPITAFHIVSTPEGLVHMAEPTATSFLFTGLSEGAVYTFQVIAENALGESPPSAPSPKVRLFPEAPIGPGEPSAPGG